MLRNIFTIILTIQLLGNFSISYARIEGPKTDIKHSIEILSDFKPDRMFQKIDSNYYYISDKHYLTWYAALHLCHSIGGHLISLSNVETLSKISKLVRNETSTINYWVDLTNLGPKGQYASMSTGSKPKYLNWCQDQSSIILNHSDRCVNIENTANPCMKSVSCDFLRSYVCESHRPMTISIAVW